MTSEEEQELYMTVFKATIAMAKEQSAAEIAMLKKQRDELLAVVKDAMWDDPRWKVRAMEAIDMVIKGGEG